MAIIRIKKFSFETQVIVFDKDGTLIDFYFLWKRRIKICVEKLITKVESKGKNSKLKDSLFLSFGYDFEKDTLDGDGPLATASLSRLYLIAAAVLYQHGISWLEAENLTWETFVNCMSKPPELKDIHPIRDIKNLFTHLTKSNVIIVIVTSDDREATITTLTELGVEKMVSFLICGDDDIPNKPKPDAVQIIQEHFEIELNKIMVVGDTVADMIMGTKAGVGCRVGVLSGAGDRNALEPYSDIVIDSINDIRINIDTTEK